MVNSKSNLKIKTLLQQYHGDINDLFFDSINNMFDYELTESLLEYQPSLIEKCGCDALMDSVRSENMEVIQLLINHGVDVNTNDGIALRTAVKHGCYQSVKSLLNASADIHVHNNKVFQYAINDSDPIMLNLLLEYHSESPEKESLKNICNGLTQRNHEIRFAYLHGEPHRVHPHQATYELCEYCNEDDPCDLNAYLQD